MESQFETASQPDPTTDAYTFLEFNTQSESECTDIPSDPICSLPTPSDATTADCHLDAVASSSPFSAFKGASRGVMSNKNSNSDGISNNEAMVDALVTGISGLFFRRPLAMRMAVMSMEMGDFVEHACQYCRVSNPVYAVRCNVPSCRKWFRNSRGNTAGSHIVKHLVVKLCAKSKEAVSSIERLTLHYQVRHFDTSEKSELHKLQQLKDEQGWDIPIVSNDKQLTKWSFSKKS